jgi:hypothetical protein
MNAREALLGQAVAEMAVERDQARAELAQAEQIRDALGAELLELHDIIGASGLPAGSHRMPIADRVRKLIAVAHQARQRAAELARS